ncbi:unnamed protein product [Meloidogyne enterolobii]|uniref:Uncharacterized protein n=1 Tax=Meloidogyne enterolobii TaxID=390850 RepID=A0ACB0Y502_MELEN
MSPSHYLLFSQLSFCSPHTTLGHILEKFNFLQVSSVPILVPDVRNAKSR